MIIRKYLLVITFFISAASIVYCQPNDVVNIIPQPVSVKLNGGKFQLSNNTKFIFSSDIDPHTSKLISEIIKNELPKNHFSTNKTSSITFSLNGKFNEQLGNEGYTLNIDPKKINITANKANGLFYAMQSLLQLIPADEYKTLIPNNNINIPCVSIVDYPRFKWRGFMLDVSRHFFSVALIKSMIDEMLRYKINTFHWHLTDDQGWRIEIKSLPQLTKIGAWRVQRTGGEFMNLQKPQPGEEATYGGFYSQDEIKDVIAYAKNKFITIIPEIDIPAHSLALIASYPNISCRQKPQYVSPGSPLTVEEDNVLCVANDSTYIIIDKILSEVAKLFSAEYIHIGGDEADKIFWDSCSKCQHLMQQNHLKNTEELQSFFIKKVSAIVASKGKKVIGWEEIMQGGLAPNAVVASWTSIDAGIKAAKLKHEVIMTPWDHGMYMDNSKIERSYSFNPVPDSVDAKYILGGEACLWTEDTPNDREVQRMFFPRALALSEIFWTPLNKKKYDDFLRRMQQRLHYFDAKKIKYSTMVFEPIVSFMHHGVDSNKIKIETEIKSLDIYYSFDNTDPDEFYPKYDGHLLAIPKGATIIKAISYQNGKPVGKMVVKDLIKIAKEEKN
ncbi:beta-hexosaminidase [mine drainage metagenome]|uniref:beta-N-acetylhexosaminidase n=1 Tax=mine drainage metagenome TaxID=410659 RepID=A0A1J5SX92_9ZZZZ